MLNNSTPMIQRITGMAESIKSSADHRPIPAQIYHGVMFQRLQKSSLTVQQRPLLAVRFNGRMNAEYTPDFIVLDGNGDAAVVCLIASSQTRPIDADRAQACLDAYREKASGLLINFGGEKLLWSLLAHLYLHQVQAEPAQVLLARKDHRMSKDPADLKDELTTLEDDVLPGLRKQLDYLESPNYDPADNPDDEYRDRDIEYLRSEIEIKARRAGKIKAILARV